MKVKEERWYEIQGDTLYVYDAPYKSKSYGSSIVHVRDMPYYRNNFRLRKIWGESPPLEGADITNQRGAK